MAVLQNEFLARGGVRDWHAQDQLNFAESSFIRSTLGTQRHDVGGHGLPVYAECEIAQDAARVVCFSETDTMPSALVSITASTCENTSAPGTRRICTSR